MMRKLRIVCVCFCLAVSACDGDGEPTPKTRCNADAMVTELCAPDGANQSLDVDFDVTYQRYEDVMKFSKPGTMNDGSVCSDIYMKPEPVDLRTYRARLTGENWSPASFPGPTLRLKIGDTLNLNFTSSLSVTSNASASYGTGHQCAEGSPADDVSPNCFHGVNDTNIHFHGSHVSPDTNGEPQFTADGSLNPEFRLVDNVYVVITPPDAGTEFPQPSCEGADCWQFPGDQVPPYQLHFTETQIPGTHWYHAHKHGSTATQMLNGLAGALIIEGDFAGIEEIENAREQILILQQIDDGQHALLAPSDSEERKRRTTPELSINGVVTPTLTMKSGEVQRWRFISATQQANASFQGLTLQNVDGSPYLPPAGTECVNGLPEEGTYKRPGVYQVAQDGIEFLDERWQDVLCNNDKYLEIDFDAGNRADFLFVAPQTDEEIVLLLRKSDVVLPTGSGGSNDGSGMPTCDQLPPDPGTFLGQNPDVPLLRIVIEADDPANPPPVESLPRNLRTFEQLPAAIQTALMPINDAELVDPQTVEFQMNPGPGQSPQFYIGCKKFCETRLDQCMALDTAEEWTITNYTTVSHPFHIHINPFFITHWFDAKDYYTGDDDHGDPCFMQCDSQSLACQDDCADAPDPTACETDCTNAQYACRTDCPLPDDVGRLDPLDPMRRWQDTIGLPSAFIPALEDGANPAPIRYGFVKIRHRFLEFDGDYVIHCHILGHEDRGMMQRIGVRSTMAACDAAQAGAMGAGCQPESVCCNECQSINVDLSMPLPDICQTASGSDPTTYSRLCIDDL